MIRYVWIVLIFVSLCFGQQSEKMIRARQGIFIEALGNGFMYSLNYERYVGKHFDWRIGGMYFATERLHSEDGQHSGSIALFLLPVMANYLLGNGNHKLELGGGPLLLYLSGSVDDHRSHSGLALRATARIGYAYLPAHGGFTFRVAYTPLLTDTFSHGVGVAVGYAFH